MTTLFILVQDYFLYAFENLINDSFSHSHSWQWHRPQAVLLEKTHSACLSRWAFSSDKVDAWVFSCYVKYLHNHTCSLLIHVIVQTPLYAFVLGQTDYFQPAAEPAGIDFDQ